jgi:hypothetical protein
VSEDGVHCSLQVHNLLPGPTRIFAWLQNADDTKLVQASLFLTVEGALARAELLRRNEWIQNHNIHRGRRARVEVNLALDGLATQHSTSFHGVAGRAVDGITSGDFARGSCTHTGTVVGPDAISDADDPWWSVVLRGGMARVRRVTIYNRADCCTEYLRGFRILLSNQSLVSSRDDASELTENSFSHVLELRSIAEMVDCGSTDHLSLLALEGPLALDCEGVASHVTIWLPGSQRILSLCEVQVGLMRCSGVPLPSLLID